MASTGKWRTRLLTRRNYLAEAMTELYFCTVLTLLSPAGEVQHLKHIFWNVRWHYKFTPPREGEGTMGHNSGVGPRSGACQQNCSERLRSNSPQDFLEQS